MRPASMRLRVRPCWKMTTGQPLAGFVPPPVEAALGTDTKMGIEMTSVATGTGLKRVSRRLFASSADGPPSQVAVSGAPGAAVVGRELYKGIWNVPLYRFAWPGNGGEPAGRKAFSAAEVAPVFATVMV